MSRRRVQKKQGAALPIVLVAVVMAVIATAMFFLKGNPVDAVTSCPKDGPESVTVLILDTSDPLAPHQIAAFNRFSNSLIRSPKAEKTVTANSDSNNYVQRRELLVAYEVADEVGQPKLLFRQCNPGNPESRDVGDKLTEGEILARIRWLKFTRGVADAFPTFRKTAPTSPIIETIRYVRRAEFPSTSDLKSSGKRAGVIFIISDLLQNSDRLTHFGDELPPVENVPAIFALDLTGIDIGLRYLKSDRYADLQQPARPHFTWWRKFFAIAGSPLNRPPEAW